MTNMGIQLLNVQETIRHNLATEGISQGELDVKRGELTVKQGQLDVQRDTLGESIRHNLVSEAQQEYMNQTGRITAEANAKNAATNAAKLALDSYKYETTGRALDEAKRIQATESANKAIADRYVAMAQAGKIGAEARLLDKQLSTEGTKVGASVTSAIGSLIRGIGSLVKVAK